MAASRPRLRAGLLEAANSRRLLAFPLWPRQRSLLAEVEAGPRIHVWALGRRSGKTTLAALVCLWDALLRPELDAKVRPGETRYAVGVATNIAQARLLIAAARSIVEESPGLAPLMVAATEDELRFELPSGARTAVRAFPCSSRGGRGWPISTLVMDEAAHFLSETDGYQTADRVFEALAPATAQFGDGARIILSSTPYGTEGLFARLYEQALSGELASARAHHAPSAEVNPTIEAEFLTAEELRDPDAFRQEYLAEFTGSGDAYLDMARFEIAERGPLEPAYGKGWVVGLDPAFSRDPFGVAVVGRDPENRRRLLVGHVDAIDARGDFGGPLETVIALADEFGARVVTDQYAAPAVLERLRRAGLAVREHAMTAATKTAIFAELRARLYAGDLEVYRHPPLVAELRRLRTKFTAGQAAVVNPRVGRSHGDIAQALALATFELRRGGGAGRRKSRSGGVDRNVLGEAQRPLGEIG